MESYFFERLAGGLTVDRVKAIIIQAGYSAGDYTYNQIDNDNVSAKGSVSMNNTRLENAARKLGIKGVTVTSTLDCNEPVAAVARSVTNLLGATNYSITIAMSQETVAALSGGNYSLYGFKAVQSSIGGGAPLVWFQSNSFGLSTDVNWEIQYQAYTSQSAIIPGGQITGLSSYDIDLGQQLAITTPQGTGTVGTGNTPLGIEVANGTTTPVTCGISEVVAGVAEPLCAFPLYGNGLDAMVPIQKVMLTFATKQVNTGTVIEKAYSQSILVDLTSANQRAVSFDINNGWSWGGFSWAQAILANSDVGPLLIEDNSSHVAGAKTLLG